MNKDIELLEMQIGDEIYYKITDVDKMRPFFISIVSDSNHWLFLASNGGISAGRKNSNYALFPYYTDDKITESAEITGSKTIFRVNKAGLSFLWEPFSIRNEGKYKITRNLYQNKYCNKILFEEINEDLQLNFQYEWSSSNLYGFVKKSKLANLSPSNVEVELIDGLQNIMPYGIPTDLQTSTSNLADAYKRSELKADAGIGIFALSAIIVDKAEPAEALKANIVWSGGIDNPTYLVSSLQLSNFRLNKFIQQEEDIKGEKGAYFVVGKLQLSSKQIQDWYFVANVNQNHAAIISLAQQIKEDKSISKRINHDIAIGTLHLKQLTGAADSFQHTADKLKDTRHYSNVLFNIMRGGIFDNNYQIEKWDFLHYLQKANKKVFEQVQNQLQQLPEEFNLFDLKKTAAETQNNDFIRLANEYLPLKFSRRHGDPSRPWNQFSINTRSEVDGSKILDYQGNWRDIFQNWEALANSYPEFIYGMISKFLNASTFDGYNPYRVTKDGFDWETIEPDNPWSYIGYWGDHQIIYLLKFLEFAEQLKPGNFSKQLSANHFVYANVPYKIKDYAEIVKNPKDTIEFDHSNEKQIHERINLIGADGALLVTANGDIYRVNFLEKILATVLSKLSNFIPEAGIWMNTQRPEWNDANNALVGNGVSMVTLYYLRRFLKFVQSVLANNTSNTITVSAELHLFFSDLAKIFTQYLSILPNTISNSKRKEIVYALGSAGSRYRSQIYSSGFSGKKEAITISEILIFVDTTLQFIEQSIRVNKRKDGLYHAYNLLSFEDDDLKIANLSEMLEGQVGILSSGFLSAQESLEVLNALKQSSLYRKDQHSYILYPNKELPKFLNKNTISKESVNSSDLLLSLLNDDNRLIIEKDVLGDFHFNGNFKNADDLSNALNKLDNNYQHLVEKEKKLLLQVFESVFNHKEFTGRSGTFFAFEGLGSIYWHMVSKLALAAQESCLWAIQQDANSEIIKQLVHHYYAITDGIGVHKSPKLYGAFPVTPYSHTPLHKGAQQPGMTGQVKEDILTRMGELGVKINDGKLSFNPYLLKETEFIKSATSASFFLTNEKEKIITLPPDSLAFTLCQVPIIYQKSTNAKIEAYFLDATKEVFESSELPLTISNKMIERTGEVEYLVVFVDANILSNE